MIALLEAQRAGLFARVHWLPNIVAGLIVGIVALPLAMAFAIASGARPEQGIYTAIIGGGLITLLGGSRVQIAGPTGAFIAILLGITVHYGIAGLQIASLMAGVILLLMGLARMGVVIRFIPMPVIVGFTAGIGVIIFFGQWPDFFWFSQTGRRIFPRKTLAFAAIVSSAAWHDTAAFADQSGTGVIHSTGQISGACAGSFDGDGRDDAGSDHTSAARRCHHR